jgi:hypothetical protein
LFGISGNPPGVAVIAGGGEAVAVPGWGKEVAVAGAGVAVVVPHELMIKILTSNTNGKRFIFFMGSFLIQR